MPRNFELSENKEIMNREINNRGFTIKQLLIWTSISCLSALIVVSVAYNMYGPAAKTGMIMDAKHISTAANFHKTLNNLSTVKSSTLIGPGKYVESLSVGVTCSEEIGDTFTLSHELVNSGVEVTYVTATGREQ
tara:strand:+ start:10 stop:411 length:402 start_codon:yes stop_codon:yes gene_type:complete